MRVSSFIEALSSFLSSDLTLGLSAFSTTKDNHLMRIFADSCLFDVSKFTQSSSSEYHWWKEKRKFQYLKVKQKFKSDIKRIVSKIWTETTKIIFTIIDGLTFMSTKQSLVIDSEGTPHGYLKEGGPHCIQSNYVW